MTASERASFVLINIQCHISSLIIIIIIVIIIFTGDETYLPVNGIPNERANQMRVAENDQRHSGFFS